MGGGRIVGGGIGGNGGIGGTGDGPDGGGGPGGISDGVGLGGVGGVGGVGPGGTGLGGVGPGEGEGDGGGPDGVGLGGVGPGPGEGGRGGPEGGAMGGGVGPGPLPGPGGWPQLVASSAKSEAMRGRGVPPTKRNVLPLCGTAIVTGSRTVMGGSRTEGWIGIGSATGRTTREVGVLGGVLGTYGGGAGLKTLLSGVLRTEGAGALRAGTGLAAALGAAGGGAPRAGVAPRTGVALSTGVAAALRVATGLAAALGTAGGVAPGTGVALRTGVAAALRVATGLAAVLGTAGGVALRTAVAPGTWVAAALCARLPEALGAPVDGSSRVGLLASLGDAPGTSLGIAVGATDGASRCAASLNPFSAEVTGLLCLGTGALLGLGSAASCADWAFALRLRWGGGVGLGDRRLREPAFLESATSYPPQRPLAARAPINPIRCSTRPARRSLRLP